MPDVWTEHPKKLKKMLSEHKNDISCGITPTILTPRDPEWTCRLEGDGWYGEVYIHGQGSIITSEFVIWLLLGSLLFGLLSGHIMGRLNRDACAREEK